MNNDISTEPARVSFLHRRRPRMILAAAASVAVLGLGVSVAVTARDDAGRAPTPTSVALALPPSGVMSSCLAFDVNFLREMPVALAGTVTALGTDTVTLDVDRWYKGGDAGQVTIAIPSGQTSAALDGVDFEQGRAYLITATEGIVNGCGFSGPATPELTEAFDAAFAG